MLDEWRRQSRDEQDSNKKAKTEGSFATSEGASALERYRMRKQQKAQQQQQLQATNDENNINSSRPPLLPRPTVSSSMTFDDDDDHTADFGGRTLSSAGTPSFSRRLTSSGRARRRSTSMGAARRTPMSKTLSQQSLSLSQESKEPEWSQSLSQTTVASAPTPTTKPMQDEEFDTVEGAGLRSRIIEQQQRIDRLEKEKMDLSMSMAPMEARYQQKEDAWNKEQNRLLLEIDSLQQASRETDGKYRDSKFKIDAMEEEIKKLRFEQRKAASSLKVQSADNSVWSRQLQNDQDVVDLKEKLRSADDEISMLKVEKVSIEKEGNGYKIELARLERSYDDLQAEYEELAASKSQNSEAEIKLEVLTTEHIATAAQLNAVCSDLAATKARAEASMEAKIEEHKKIIAQLQFDMSVLKTRAAKVVEDEEKSLVDTDEEDEAVLRARIEERDRRIAELEAQLLEGEQLRRSMHNRIQELRGNIRVFVRTRPFLPGDGGQTDPSIDVCPDGESLSIVDRRGSGDHGFKFDKVFPPSAGQDLVFNEVADFVQSALDGYQVCLFSYGQTGSGKTHTMQGSGNGAMRGIIPRAVEKILQEAGILRNQKWKFNLSASFLEIYNEELKDLLVTMKGSNRTSKPEKLAIKRNRQGKSFVENLAEIPIDTSDTLLGMQQLESVMEAAARSRSVACTKMNAQSSRSHSVFMLHLRGFNEESGAVVHGALNLCDLAGSERLDRSGVGNDAKRLRETLAINKSLSCLGDVFNALATKAAHIPYRNSKLTYLLQDCLSGDGKALMFVNLSPTFQSSNESLCSLRFAQRVNQVELGKATKHVQYAKGKR